MDELLGVIEIKFDFEIFIYVALCVSFLTKLVILKLKLYNASYALHNPLELGPKVEI